MGEMLESLAVPCQVRIEHTFTIILVAAPDDVVMGTRDDLDGVELHETDLANECGKIELADGRLRQTDRVEEQTARLAVLDPESRSHGNGAAAPKSSTTRHNPRVRDAVILSRRLRLVALPGRRPMQEIRWRALAYEPSPH